MTTTSTEPKKFGDAAELAALVRDRKPMSNLAALPKKLSPSRAASYNKCPQAFYYSTVCKIREPGSHATLRGTLAHSSFERIFDHPQGERTPELAVSYIRPAWEKLVSPDLDSFDSDLERERAVDDAADAVAIAPRGSAAEAELLAAAEDCVRAWFDMERVNNFTPTDLELPDGRKIDGRELYVWAKLEGVTAHGFVDRLDRYETADGQVRWSISDYKTSAQVPWLKNPNWGPSLRNKIRDDYFFQLKVYAALAWHLFGIKVGMLRLVYVATGDRDNGIAVEYVTQQMVDDTVKELERTWKRIKSSARTGNWPTKTGPLCSWCYFHDICPAWAPEVADIVAEDPANS